jgi:hypothetical protein
MNKTSSLTKAQEAKFPFYVDKWIKIGLCTDPVDRTDLTTPNLIREKILGLKPTPAVYMDNPMSAWLAVLSFCKDIDQIRSQVWNQVWNQVENQVRSQVWNQVENQIKSQVWSQVRSQVESQVEIQVWNQVENQVRSQVWNQVESQVWSQVRSQVESQVWNQVWSQVRSQVENQVRSQVWNQVENQVRSQVRSQVESQVEIQVWNQVRSFIYPYIDGYFSASYFSFYDFMNKELNIELSPLWDLYMKTAQWGFFYPLKNVTVICDRPREIHMKNKVLHCEAGPAIRYAGEPKFEVYCLNGVKVPEEIVTTSADKLDPKLLLKEPNAQVRCEIVRKIGMENVLSKLNARILDDKGAEGYCLYDLDLGDGRRRPYLRMFNPSEKVWHIEGVPPEVATVDQALESRNKSKKKPLILT